MVAICLQCKIQPEGDCSIFQATLSRRQVAKWALEKKKSISSIIAGLNEGSNECTSGYGSINGGDICTAEISSREGEG